MLKMYFSHVDAFRFMNENILCKFFLRDMFRLIDDYSDQQRLAFQNLNKTIVSEIVVVVHQQYNSITDWKIFLVYSSFQDFLKIELNSALKLQITALKLLNIFIDQFK